MPGMSGLELPRLLNEVNLVVPMIFVSANHNEFRAKALKQGAVAVISKPFSDGALLDAIRLALQSSV